MLLGLAGCAGAQAPTTAEQQAGEALRTGQTAPASHVSDVAATQIPTPVVSAPAPVVVPPAARQAVQDAYDAVNKRRWAELDRLVPLADMVNLVEGLGSRATLRVLRSAYGHDAFLKETDRIDALLASALHPPGETR